MEFNLTGKVALVTGSSRGIGRNIAVTLAAEGCDVMVTGRDEDALKQVVAEIIKLGRKAAHSIVDLSKKDAAEVLSAAISKNFGRLDVLVNNAGATKRGDFLTLTNDDWQDGFALKFFGHVYLSRVLWPMLQSSHGSIVFIAGTGARIPGQDFTIGSSVNSACIAFAKAIADRGKHEGVQVNSINPGHTVTERFDHQMEVRMKRLGQDKVTVREEYRKELDITRFGLPEDIGNLVAFIVSSRGSWLHGATIDMDGGEVPGL